MKKSLIFVLLTALVIGGIYYNNSVSAHQEAMSNTYNYNLDLGFYKKYRSGIIYKMESRFLKTISKEKLYAAKSVRDIFPLKSTLGIESFHTVSFGILENEKENVKVGDDEHLTDDQLALIKTIEYSDNIYVRAYYKVRNAYSGEMEEKQLIYYLSIVPEKEAVYMNGYDSFISYLKLNSNEKSLSIDNKKLKPGRIIFTVNKNGAIENAKVESTSGYAALDDNLLELINKMPGNWQPASNSLGEKVNQDFVFFFGLEGC
ncbi:TonB family C-terminal domain-containing protein [Spirosomataceae bacterium TFI 002]|nr:TonB family C-terminal domain-containing protein [Spirosomataceae bacterium TFI 002]